MTDRSTQVIVIRHGETDWNAEARIQGQLDPPLNAAGRWQAARLRQALAAEPIDCVYASDLSRARDTAAALAGNRPLQIEPALRERAFGAFQGLTHDEISRRWPEDCGRWRRRDIDFAPDGGESLRRFHARVVGCAESLAARHPGESIAIVAHGGVLDCLYRAATGTGLQQLRTWSVGNASINRLLYRDGGFAMVAWSDRAHLEGVADTPGGDEPPPRVTQA